MRYIICAGACAFALCLGACSQFDSAIDDATAWIASPQTQQAIGSLKSGAAAFTCAVADVSAVAQQIEAGVGAGQSLIATNGKVYVASASVCAALGGSVGPLAVVP